MLFWSGQRHPSLWDDKVSSELLLKPSKHIFKGPSTQIKGMYPKRKITSLIQKSYIPRIWDPCGMVWTISQRYLVQVNVEGCLGAAQREDQSTLAKPFQIYEPVPISSQCKHPKARRGQSPNCEVHTPYYKKARALSLSLPLSVSFCGCFMLF